ncbi:Caffeyl-CoA reductase-Etf complex subunit CarE [Candidatus Entotheonellaceae bacterium PAL068K]
MAAVQDVLIIGELTEQHLSRSTAELLAAGRQLLQPPGDRQVVVGLAGSNLSTAAQEALHAGADRVYTVDHTLLSSPLIDLCLVAFQAVCQTVSPHLILLGRTALGRELAPRLACRLGVSLLQDCLQVSIDAASGRLIGTRPVYGGNVLARLRCNATPQIAALRPGAMAPLEPDRSRQGDIVAVPVELHAGLNRVTVLQQELDDSPGVKLEDARVVVSGGRGLGGPEPFRELQELAGLLQAGIGASRAAVDAGWVPGNWQIGLTGKTITPDLYLTVGISGASQHMAGCANARVIVAINKDREANIFRVARYGVVGDWETVLPAFMAAVRDLALRPSPGGTA